MDLLIVRHAIAADPAPGQSDAERPLTPEGEKRFAKGARGLAKVCGAPDVLLTSPLLRARQTAALLAQAWGGLTPMVAPALAGSSIADMRTLAREHAARKRIVFVGHEPTVSELLAALLGAGQGAFEFKKGAAALVEIGDAMGTGRLCWYLTPRVLRALAD